MSEYQERHTEEPASSAHRPATSVTMRAASRIEAVRGGVLYRVILFDEIEKANPEVECVSCRSWRMAG